MGNEHEELSVGVFQFIEQIINEKFNAREREIVNTHDVLSDLEKITNQVYNVIPLQNQGIATTFSEILISFGELITEQAQQIKNVTISNERRVTYLESYNFEDIVTMQAGATITGTSILNDLSVSNMTTLNDVSINGFAQLYSDLSVNGLTNMNDLSVSNMTTLNDVSINGFAQLYSDLSVNGLTNMNDLSVSNMTTLNDVSINGIIETKQNITTKPYADISAFTNFSEWIGIYDLSARATMISNDTNLTACDLSYVSTYFSKIPNQCISGNLNNGKFLLLTHDLSNILKNTLLEVNFSCKGIFDKAGSLELSMINTSSYSIDARSVYPEKARTMCYGPQFFKTNDLSGNNLHFHLDLSSSNGTFVFEENPRLTLKLRNLL